MRHSSRKDQIIIKRRFPVAAIVIRIIITIHLLTPPIIHASGFTDTHDDGDSLNNPDGSNWTDQGTRTWSESAGQVSVQDMSNEEGHLINDYNCRNDGAFEVVIKNNDNWNSFNGGVLFRWTSTSSYYFVGIVRGDNINNNGSLYWGNNTIPGTHQDTIGFNMTEICTLKVVCSNSLFTVFVNGVLRLTYEDTSHPSGKVGYGYSGEWSGAYLNWLECEWSDSGYTAPTITTHPKSDTIAAGNSASLFVTATGIPMPTYQWQKDTSGAWENISGATDSTYTILSAALMHTGNYRAIASNAGGADTSEEAYIMVYNSIRIIEQPLDDTVFTGDTAVFGITATGGPPLTYQWQSDKSGTWEDISGATSSTYSFIAGTGDDGVYVRCVINIFTVDSITSNSALLTVREIYNPFKLTIEGADIITTNKVQVSIWSDEDLSDFPTTDQGSSPWSDYLLLAYKSIDYAADTAGVSVKLYSTEEIKQTAPDSLNPFEDTLTVGMLPTPNDSTWYFSYTTAWHNQGQPDTLLKPFKNDGSIVAIDTTVIINVLMIHGEYVMNTDTALLVIDSIAKLNAASDSIVVIQLSEFSDFNTLKFDTVLTVSDLLPATSDTVNVDGIAPMPILKDTLYLRWYIVGKNQKTSPIQDTAFTIGWDRPVYTGSLTADSIAGQGDGMKFSWDAPEAGRDSVRIWWNTSSPIPLSHDPGLPQNQAFYPDFNDTADTMYGLNASTLYYFGLQVYDDGFWSVITPASSDTMQTAAGDTTIVSNVIKIDSTGFDTERNSLVVYWHVDFSLLPSGKGYESGYTKTLELLLDTAVKPMSWDTMAQESNKTEIVLASEIVFDTVYTVGLWLRVISPEGKPGIPSCPTDSSTATIQTPDFTWQVLNLFASDSDTVLAINDKVFIIKMNIYVDISDTLKNYGFLPVPLPEGFVPVGSPCISFNPMEKDPPQFKLGLRYDTLPPGITESDLALYQYYEDNNEFYVLHNSEVNNGAVFAAVTKDNMSYPFVVLADTLSPVITPDSSNDTIIPGNDIPVWFALTDNIANAYWELKYGPGNEGYLYEDSGYLTQSNDISFSHLARVKDTGTVIDSMYGVRVLLIGNDGVHSDTANVSQCVKSSNSETFNLKAKEWTAVRTTKGLDNPALEKVFAVSVNGNKGWEYDIFKYRIYRWYNSDSGEKNSWLEYDDAVKEDFRFIPGRLIWCKTADNVTLSFGEGVTTSLKEPYEIILKPDNWTDFSMPFQFPVMLRDVLEKSSRYGDSLEVYHWEYDSSGYTTRDLFIFALDNIAEVEDTLISEQKNDGYTAYNHFASPVNLRIPPISLPLSQYPSCKNENRKKMNGSWDISVRWREANTGINGFKNRIRCGYKENEGGKLFGPSPPSMGSTEIGFYDSGNNRICYWALQQGLDKNGGVSFELSFRNHSDNAVTIEYFLEKLEVLPDGCNAMIFDPKSGKYEEYSRDNIASIKLVSQGEARRILAVGSDSYFRTVMNEFLPLKLLSAYPNPFNGRVTIRYRIPSGIKKVRFALFNLQGKLLWQGIEWENIQPGEHRYHLNANSGGGNNLLSAGVYIVRLNAINLSGRNIYGGEKRITCIK